MHSYCFWYKKCKQSGAISNILIQKSIVYEELFIQSLRDCAISSPAALITVPTKGANYYFSTSIGDDSRTVTDAQNPITPWKTLNKLNSFFSSLKPGDSVLFKRGDIFYGSIAITKSGTSSLPIVLSAYGTGNGLLLLH